MPGFAGQVLGLLLRLGPLTHWNWIPGFATQVLGPLARWISGNWLFVHRMIAVLVWLRKVDTQAVHDSLLLL